MNIKLFGANSKQQQKKWENENTKREKWNLEQYAVLML